MDLEVDWEYLLEARRIKELALMNHAKGARLKALFKSRSGKTRTIYYYNPKDIPETISVKGNIFYLWSVKNVCACKHVKREAELRRLEKKRDLRLFS